MVLSGSSGNMDINHCPVLCNTTFDLALFTHSGWLRSGTSQAKNRKATTTMTSPRPSPNRKPSVRSSAPTRLSSTCLLYTSDAADEEDSVDLGGRRIINK